MFNDRLWSNRPQAPPPSPTPVSRNRGGDREHDGLLGQELDCAGFQHVTRGLDLELAVFDLFRQSGFDSRPGHLTYSDDGELARYGLALTNLCSLATRSAAELKAN